MTGGKTPEHSRNLDRPSPSDGKRGVGNAEQAETIGTAGLLAQYAISLHKTRYGLVHCRSTADEIKGIARAMNADLIRDVFTGKEASEGRADRREGPHHLLQHPPDLLGAVLTGRRWRWREAGGVMLWVKSRSFRVL